MHRCTPTSKSASWSTTGCQRRWTDPVGAWLPSRQRSDDLPRYPRRTAEPARSFSEVRTSETTASWETASQERQRRTSWQVHHIAPHRRVSCQCSEPFRPWPLGSGYCGGQARKGMGLLREFFPKGKDITDTPEDYIQQKYHELNLRPRKCLGYKTSYEVYFSKVLHLA